MVTEATSVPPGTTRDYKRIWENHAQPPHVFRFPLWNLRNGHLHVLRSLKKKMNSYSTIVKNLILERLWCDRWVQRGIHIGFPSKKFGQPRSKFGINQREDARLCVRSTPVVSQPKTKNVVHIDMSSQLPLFIVWAQLLGMFSWAHWFDEYLSLFKGQLTVF